MHHPRRHRPIIALVAQRCAQLGFSHRTVENYGYRLAVFEDWAGCSALEASMEQAAAWQAACAARCRTRRVLHHNHCALVFLWRHLRGGELDRRLVPSVQPEQSPPGERASPAELARLFAGIRDDRHRRFCQFVYATGLRASEAQEARMRDLDLVGRSLAVRVGKGRRPRRTILSDGIIAVLRPYLHPHRPDARLFTADDAPDGPPIRLDAVNGALHAARGRIGIHRRLSLHRLRHCFAMHLHERGAALVELQALLGHSSPALTLVYLGMREERRGDLASFGDLLAALPPVRAEQARIMFG